jgi:DNA-binding IclR family transcriptional regulator
MPTLSQLRSVQKPDSDAADRGSVRAVERAVALLFHLAEQPRSQSLHQLARDIGCSKSTVHRLLATLERLEIVERHFPYNYYQLGRRFRELAGERGQVQDLRQVAYPTMEKLRDQSQETVALSLFNGYEHVVIDQCESPHELRRTYTIGHRVPLLNGATAKAMLAFLPQEQTREILAHTRTPEYPGPGEDELQTIRDFGYAFSDGARVPGSAAIAAPIRDRAGRVCAALSISGPSFRFTASHATRSAPALKQAAEAIEAALRDPSITRDASTASQANPERLQR